MQLSLRFPAAAIATVVCAAAVIPASWGSRFARLKTRSVAVLAGVVGEPLRALENALGGGARRCRGEPLRALKNALGGSTIPSSERRV
ncbi:MAG TPA: hypothetical protein VGL65_04345 [Gemmatimonadales bacterium]